MDPKQVAKKVIAENLFMVLATSDQNIPWVSPVFYATGDNKTFYWHSAKNTKHSHIIAQNPHLAVVIFNSTNPEIPGLYMKGKAEEVTDKEEIVQGISLLFGKALKDEDKRQELIEHPEDFQDEARLRVYKFTVEEFYLSNSERWNDKWVDWTDKVEGL